MNCRRDERRKKKSTNMKEASRDIFLRTIYDLSSTWSEKAKERKRLRRNFTSLTPKHCDQWSIGMLSNMRSRYNIWQIVYIWFMGHVKTESEIVKSALEIRQNVNLGLIMTVCPGGLCNSEGNNHIEQSIARSSSWIAIYILYFIILAKSTSDKPINMNHHCHN